MGIIERFSGRLKARSAVMKGKIQDNLDEQRAQRKRERAAQKAAFKNERLRLARRKGIEKARAGGFTGRASRGLAKFGKKVAKTNKENKKEGYDPFNV